MAERPVAVFDIDGTVFRSSLFLELMDAFVARDIFPKDVATSYAREREEWLDRRGDYQLYVDKTVHAFVSHIKGVSYDAAVDAARDIIEAKKDRVYCYTRDLIHDLKREGYFLLAISHSPFFIAEGFGFEAGFDKTYGFFYETGPSGAFTGEVADLDLIRNKAAVLQRAVRKENLTLARSVGVGDTETDIPMLEMVERPIAFNPNRKLYDHAKLREWKIVVERKNVVYEL